jgi:hypothetical protein
MELYFTLIAPGPVVDGIEAAAIEGDTNLKVEPASDFLETEGLAFDFETVRSILVWIHDNKELLAFSLQAITQIRKLFPNSKKGEPQRIAIRPPSGEDVQIIIYDGETAEQLADKIREAIPKLKQL